MKVVRPWGTYEVLRPQDDNFLLKKIVVNPQQRLSLQSHEHRSEHWVVVQGEGEVTIRENVVPCEVDSQFFIPRGTKHRIHNTSVDAPLIFVEVQVGNILEEGDIVRYEDDYLRSK